ncbi:MAG: hypothetical protein KUG79_14020 [Pseudomonadales bacterium]|nr:hypothetical protein [Pseudomonadales bacterium]
MQPKDLYYQAETGNGERLAQPVKDRSVLVNNELIFTMPGNAVLGIAMSVGAIKVTTKALEDMAPIGLVELVSSNIPVQLQNMAVILAPYCYLFGHPDAYVESRIAITNNIYKPTNSSGPNTINDRENTTTLKRRSERRPVRGAQSWVADNGELLASQCREGVLKLLNSMGPEIEWDSS